MDDVEETSGTIVKTALNAKSVAIIGASEDVTKWGGSILGLLKKFRYGGKIYPVNLKLSQVQALRAYPSVSAIGLPVDVAVIAVPHQHTVSAFEDCARAGVKVVLMVTSQFAESGAEGAALQERILGIARDSGMRVIGPNCMGYFNSYDNLCLLNSQALMRNDDLVKGKIALISQSGALAGAMLARAYDLGTGFSFCVSLGNQADLEVCDFLEYAIEDPNSRVIALYVEGLKSPERFIAQLRAARRAGKPVLIVKAGRSASGQRAVQSHTASMAGEFRSFASSVQHAGAVLVDDFLELVAQAAAWSSTPAPGGPRVAVFSGSGGGGAVASDLVSEAGLVPAVLSPEGVEKLSTLMPRAAARLPFDIGAVPTRAADSQWLRDALDGMLADTDVDAGLFLLTTMPQMAAVARTVAELNRGAAKPVVFVNAASSAGAEAEDVLKQEGLVNFAGVKESLAYLRNRVAYAEHIDVDPVSVKIDLEGVDAVAAEWQAGLVSEFEAKRMLRAAGLPVTRGKLARGEDEAVDAAREIGYPVVMKLVSAQISHKSDVGGVVLDVEGDAEVRRHYQALAAAVAAVPGATFDGCLVQQQAAADVELLIGTHWDPQFGAMLMVGIGGTLVELLKDTALLPADSGPRTIRRAVERLRLYPLLNGYRGKPVVDLDLVADAAQRFGQLAIHLGARLIECEANPVMIRENRMVIADARATWGRG